MNHELADQLSKELRKGQSDDLRRRRQLFACSLTAAGAMGVISLYQMGLMRRLPDPPHPLFKAECIDSSSEAYKVLRTPDAVLGFASYGVTMVLAAAGGRDRARVSPWIPLALGAKVAADAAGAAKLTVDQWTKHRGFCAWCLLAAGATFATVPLALPEARRAFRNLTS